MLKELFDLFVLAGWWAVAILVCYLVVRAVMFVWGGGV